MATTDTRPYTSAELKILDSITTAEALRLARHTLTRIGPNDVTATRKAINTAFFTYDDHGDCITALTIGELIDAALQNDTGSSK